MAKYLAMARVHRTPEGSVEHVLDVFDEFSRRIEQIHVPEFLGIDVTMSQAKILMLLANEREVQMSDLVRRLGISLSTMSGHVDRLVEQGFVVRRDDPADRRHVLIAATPAAHELVERFRELNTAQLRRLLDHMTRDERLDIVRAFHHINRAIEALPPQADVPRKESSR